MNSAQLKSALEAVLFASGEPIKLERLAEAVEAGVDITEQALLELSAEYEKRNSGIELLRLENKYQLATRPEYADCIKRAMEEKRQAPLSQAALEVLAIIAYNQPVTKSFIEQVRGVDCSGVISSLLRRELIEEAGRLDLPGRPLLYCTTTNFLRTFCISSLDELPPLPENDDAVKIISENLAEMEKAQTEHSETADGSAKDEKEPLALTS